MAHGRKQSNPSFFAKLMLKLFVKNIVVGDKPCPKNSRASLDFIVADQRDFEKEKAVLTSNIKETEAKGASFFGGKESGAFDKLTSKEWNTQFGKHLDHHLAQFDV